MTPAHVIQVRESELSGTCFVFRTVGNQFSREEISRHSEMSGSNITNFSTVVSTNGTASTENPLEYLIVLAILGSLGVLFNGVLLFVFWRNKTPEFRVGTCYVIGNLALADCLTGKLLLLTKCQ